MRRQSAFWLIRADALPFPVAGQEVTNRAFVSPRELREFDNVDSALPALGLSNEALRPPEAQSRLPLRKAGSLACGG